MKLYSLSLTIIIIIASAAAIGVASRYFLGDDNVVEEVAEEVIQVETGEKVDLSPEKKNVSMGRPKVVIISAHERRYNRPKEKAWNGYFYSQS